MINTPINFIENPSIRSKENKYITVDLDINAVIRDWRQSLFSFEWLLPDGSVRSVDEMAENIRTKYAYALSKLEKNDPIPMPILGIGVLDNIEIGSGKEFVILLHVKKQKKLTAHILIHDEKEFIPYLYK